MPRASKTVLLLGLIVAFGLELRFRAANHPYISQWDEAYHALVAKNLIAHPLRPTLYEEKVLPTDDLEWTKAGVWLHKPPLPLWLMAFGIATFGEHELSFRLASVILDTIAIVLIFLLGEELFGEKRRPAGLIAAALYAVNPLMIRLVSGRIPDDTPHTINVFFITLTVLSFAVASRKNSRAYALAAGFSLGLGTLCMTAVALLGLAASLPFMLNRKGLRLLAVAFVSFLIAAVPWPLYCLAHWPELWRHESAIQTIHLFTAIDDHGHPWWWFLEMFPLHFGLNAVVAYVAALVVGVYAVRHRTAGVLSALCWAAIPYVFFSLIATKLYSYTCVAVPALCLLAGLAVSALWAARETTPALVYLLAIAGQFSWVALVRARADYSYCPWNDVYDYPSFRQVMYKIRTVPGPKVVLNVGDNKAPQAMYYSGAAAYSDAPDAATARDLLSRGYRVFVLLQQEKRGTDIPAALRAPEFRGKISYVPLPSPLVLDGKHPYEA